MPQACCWHPGHDRRDGPISSETVGVDVVVLSPNTAIDSYYSVRDFGIGEVNRADDATHTAGGKGINVARALRLLGGRPHCVGLVGGTAGAFIRQELRREGIGSTLIDSGVETRRTTTVVEEASGRTTVVADPGIPVPAICGERLIAAGIRASRNAQFVAIVGSLQLGLPVDLYREFIAGVKASSSATICVDSEGEPLRQAVGAGPALVKINRAELASTFGPASASSIDAMANAHRGLGVDVLIVTDGPAGAFVFSRDRSPFSVVTDLDRVVSAVGAGDTFLAGLIDALGRGLGLQKAAVRASAAAAANVLRIGSGTLDPTHVARLARRTRIERPNALARAAS
jgi:tagatose 6-phosphate kinase